MAALALLYERLGGEQAFQDVVAEFYRRVLADVSLAHFFSGVDMDALREHQKSFLIHAMGGPGDYHGRDMKSAHAGLRIEKKDFYAVADHLVDALAAMGVDEETIGEVVDRLEPLSREIVNHPKPC